MHTQELFPDHRFVLIGEVASTLGVSIDTVRRWEKKGLLRGIRNQRGQRAFLHEEILAFKTRLETHTPAHWRILRHDTPSPYTVTELFAGAGGLALGLENAGLHANCLVEIDKTAAKTLSANRPHWNVQSCDVRHLSFEKNASDIVTGGFPCQAFSYAGKKMGFEDTRGTLFFEDETAQHGFAAISLSVGVSHAQTIHRDRYPKGLSETLH